MEKFIPLIQKILQESDLTTISARKVRKMLLLSESHSADDLEMLKRDKEALDKLIVRIYTQLSTPALAQAETQKQSQDHEEENPPSEYEEDNEEEYIEESASKRHILSGGGLKGKTSVSYGLSSELKAIIGEKDITPFEMTSMLWKYIKEQDLQDPRDKRYIICDQKLKAMFGVQRVHMFDMQKRLRTGRHIYTINPTTSYPSTTSNSEDALRKSPAKRHGNTRSSPCRNMDISTRSGIVGIHHVAIICSDYQTSKLFYSKLLGMKILNETYRSDRKSYKLDLQISSSESSSLPQIELFSFPAPIPKRPSRPEAAGARHLCFAVDDLDEFMKGLKRKARDIGRSSLVRFEDVRVDEITGERFVFMPDPDDLPLEYKEVRP